MGPAGIRPPRVLRRDCGIDIQKAVAGRQKISGGDPVVPGRVPLDCAGLSAGHGTDLRIRQEGKGKRTVVRRCLKCARTGAGDLIGIRTAREKACQLCGVKVFPSRIRPDRCGGIDSCPRRPGDGDRPMDRVRRGIRQISSVRRLADVQRHLPHAAGRQTREDAEQAQGRSQERGDAPGSDVRLHLPSLSLFRCAHLSGPK